MPLGFYGYFIRTGINPSCCLAEALRANREGAFAQHPVGSVLMLTSPLSSPTGGHGQAANLFLQQILSMQVI